MVNEIEENVELSLLGEVSDATNLERPSPLIANNHVVDGGEYGPYPPYKPIYKPPKKPVDINVMKRNMSIAKGFMDISLLTANSSQLRNLLKHGDSSGTAYKIILTLLCLSLILQIATGILLIVKEQFDLNLEEDHESAELYNNITVMLVFFTLLINVFVSSFGIDVMLHHYPPQGPHQVPHKGPFARVAFDHLTNSTLGNVDVMESTFNVR